MRLRKRASLEHSSRASGNSVLRQLEALEPRVLLSSGTGLLPLAVLPPPVVTAASTTQQYAKFAVNIVQAGTYIVDVYQSTQQFPANVVTNLTLGQVNAAIPVVVRLAGTPVPITGWTLAACWNLTLSPGRDLIQVNNAYFLATVPAPVQPAPSNLIVTAPSGTAIQLQWTDNSSNETGFAVQRQAVGGGGSSSWTLVSTTSINATTFTDASVQGGTQYSYRVLAVSDAGSSAASNVASATTPATLPASPSNLALTVLSSTTMQLAWSDNSSDETGFLIERQTSGSGTWDVVTTTAANVTGYTDATLQAGTQYAYRVSAVNGAGVSNASNVAVATTTVAVPGTPANLALTVQSAYAIQLNWADPSNETGFQIERETDGTGTWSVIATPGQGVTTYADATVQPGTQYWYRVSALNTAGASAASNAVNATTAAVIVPGTGWTGPTAQPATMGLPGQAMYTENAIARWDVVPYQTFTGTFNVGVVAFDSAGIDHVAISVNGGPWTNVSQMTLNPQTGNSSAIGVKSAGVVEYWATLRASDFAADGQVEVRAIAYPTVGVPRVLQGATVQANGVESLFLNADGHQTLPTITKFVSPTGSDTTGDGSQGNPFATIFKASLAIQAASGISKADNGTIYLTAGNYDWAGRIANGGYNSPEVKTLSGWLTITAAPGVAANQVNISTCGGSADMLHTKLVRLKGITLSTNLAQSNDLASMVWFDGSILTGTGTANDLTFAGPTSWTGGILVTDCSVGNSVFGVQSAMLQRNVAVNNIGSDAFTNSLMVINSTAQNITVPTGSGYHPDVLQLFGIFNNVIYYGISATQNVNSQGLFLDHADFPTSLKDAAFVNFNINNQTNGQSDYQVFQFCCPCQNMLVLDSKFVGPAYWRTDLGFSAVDVVVTDTTFSVLPGPVAGVTYN